LGKQNHRRHFPYHQISSKQGGGKEVLGQQEKEPVAKQTFWQSWLGASGFMFKNKPDMYKVWRRIVNTFNSFKTFWVAKITLVNQTAAPTSQYGYGMAATTNNDSIVSYGDSIGNFSATYTVTQESVKSQGTMIALMQSQLNAMTQYCMVLQQ
jgi:hypothetical protein